MRRSSTVTPSAANGSFTSGSASLQRTPSSASTSSAFSEARQNRRATLDVLQGLRSTATSDDPLVQLVEMGREVDRLEDEVEGLKLQLAARPPKNEIEAMKRENKELETLIQAYQRENEKSLAKEKRIETREKLLEAALEKAHGPNWGEILEIPFSPSSKQHAFPSSRTLNNMLPSAPSLSTPIRPSGSLLRQASTSSTPTPLQNSWTEGSETPSSPSVAADASNETPQRSTPGGRMSAEELEGVKSQVESLRMLIQGVDRRLVRREGESTERIKRAEEETARWSTTGGRGGGVEV